MDEYRDVYDKNRVFQNRTILRGDKFKEGEYYVCCEVWLKNSKGELLITLRNPNKKREDCGNLSEAAYSPAKLQRKQPYGKSKKKSALI